VPVAVQHPISRASRLSMAPFPLPSRFALFLFCFISLQKIIHPMYSVSFQKALFSSACNSSITKWCSEWKLQSLRPVAEANPNSQNVS
jgi:hypothetical protein